MSKIDQFNLRPGTILAAKYEVLTRLGRGYEGEVYQVREAGTGIERAAKLFYPQRNPRNRVVMRYAQKLHKLRDCHMLIHYHNQEQVELQDHLCTLLVSEYVEGEILSEFLRRQPGRRLAPFPALHLLHALAKGVQDVHDAGEYHGDLHKDNVIVRRYGLGFDLKLVDLYDWGKPSKENMRVDVVDLIRIFYDALGGAKQYSKQPPVVKQIVCGLKATLITRKFPNAGFLRRYLEHLDWEG